MNVQQHMPSPERLIVGLLPLEVHTSPLSVSFFLSSLFLYQDFAVLAPSCNRICVRAGFYK